MNISPEMFAFYITLKLPCGSDGKESACTVGDLGSIPGLGRSPGERKGIVMLYWIIPTPVFWPGEFHGLYSPWGHKESDMTDFHFHFSWRRKWQPTPVFLPEESPWTEKPCGLQSMGSQEWDITYGLNHQDEFLRGARDTWRPHTIHVQHTFSL